MNDRCFQAAFLTFLIIYLACTLGIAVFQFFQAAVFFFYFFPLLFYLLLPLALQILNLAV